jgi:hypothetical protein
MFSCVVRVLSSYQENTKTSESHDESWPRRWDGVEGGLSKPVIVNLLRSPGIDSQPGGIDSSESIPALHKLLQIWSLCWNFLSICGG